VGKKTNKKTMTKLVLLPLLQLLSLSVDAGNTSTVYVIRHGEKNWMLGCLSAQGQQRASALPGIFNGKPSGSHETFATPGALFANHYDDGIDCERCKQTLTPISQSLGLPIIFDYGYSKKLGGNQAAAEAILRFTQNTTTVLVAWEHVNIQFLVANLGVDKSLIPHWKDSDYDTVYKLTFEAGGSPFFLVSHENFTSSIPSMAEAS
jgi:hypothetical protein